MSIMNDNIYDVIKPPSPRIDPGHRSKVTWSDRGQSGHDQWIQDDRAFRSPDLESKSSSHQSDLNCENYVIMTGSTDRRIHSGHTFADPEDNYMRMSSPEITTNQGYKRSKKKAVLRLAAYVNCGMLTVHLMRARNLQSTRNSLCRSFIKVSLEPDDADIPKCCTEVIKDTNSPIYEEKFSFELLPDDFQKRIYISTWNTETKQNEAEFLGGMSFGIWHIYTQKRIVDGWYYLLPLECSKRNHLLAASKQQQKQSQPTTKQNDTCTCVKEALRPRIESRYNHSADPRRHCKDWQLMSDQFARGAITSEITTRQCEGSSNEVQMMMLSGILDPTIRRRVLEALREQTPDNDQVRLDTTIISTAFDLHSRIPTSKECTSGEMTSSTPQKADTADDSYTAAISRACRNFGFELWSKTKAWSSLDDLVSSTKTYENINDWTRNDLKNNETGDVSSAMEQLHLGEKRKRRHVSKADDNLIKEDSASFQRSLKRRKITSLSFTTKELSRDSNRVTWPASFRLPFRRRSNKSNDVTAAIDVTRHDVKRQHKNTSFLDRLKSGVHNSIKFLTNFKHK